jgi:hypothetical protein
VLGVVVVVGIVPTVEVMGAVMLEPVVLEADDVLAAAALVLSVALVPFPPVIVIVIAGPRLGAEWLGGCARKESYKFEKAACAPARSPFWRSWPIVAKS